MSLNLKDIVGNIFHISDREKQEEETQTAELLKMMNNTFGVSQANTNQMTKQQNNPFLNNGRSVVDAYLNYQSLANSNNNSPALDDPTSPIKGYQTPRLNNYDLLNRMRERSNLANSMRERSLQVNNDLLSRIRERSRQKKSQSQVHFNGSLDPNTLGSLDVVNELPKLSTEQIASIISKHFSNSTVIKPSDAEGIYKAQQTTGMSALAILGIGALESGYGTSSIAKQKNNLWGWNATNKNPSGNATAFSPISEGAAQFANKYLSTYYNGYGAKTINSAGTGDNPAGKGYAYFDDGTINKEWAKSIGSIMGTFYNTAKSVTPSQKTSHKQNSVASNIVNAAQKYLGTPYVWGGESMSEGGMDCSGFVYNALKDSGYKVGRTTAQGYRSYGKSVSKSEMQPGDLIFYGSNKNDASHIAIYIGNGQMIHSSGGSKNTKSNPGKGVSIANVDYRSDFIEARRY